MSAMVKAAIVAVVQVLIVCSLGAKLLYDRQTRPQAWFRTVQYDPGLPIRGRYLNLQLELADSRTPEELRQKFPQEANSPWFGHECGSIVMRGDVPTVVFDDGQTYNCDNLAFARTSRLTPQGTEFVARLDQSVLFFIPDTAQNAAHLNTGDELWVLATIPKKGPPRPIELAIKKAGETQRRLLELRFFRASLGGQPRAAVPTWEIV